ncbi:hypothetical protein GF386_02460 [Candidatus Pacearchaeota archaeon]|nr:hypothetical protein [Candidatus Pacearchaeota archaeon]MBD3283006.1 hypothetical protein [Candidatus Pacearchaeota archaeon]
MFCFIFFIGYELADRNKGEGLRAVLYLNRTTERKVFVSPNLRGLGEAFINTEIIFDPSEVKLLPENARDTIAGDITTSEQSIKHFRGVYSAALRGKD